MYHDGLVVAPLTGWLDAAGLLRLRGIGLGAAVGAFLPGTVSFLTARSHTPPAHDWRVAREATGRVEGRDVTINPGEVFSNETARLLVQLALPGVLHTRKSVDGGPPIDYLTDLDSGSHAAFIPTTGQIRQTGPVRIWDRVEDTVTGWRQAGSPDHGTFTIRITPEDGQLVTAAGVIYRLPDPTPP